MAVSFRCFMLTSFIRVMQAICYNYIALTFVLPMYRCFIPMSFMAKMESIGLSPK